MSTKIWLGLLMALLLSACHSMEASEATVYHNFVLIDGTDRQPVSDASMVVENGRITWVGPSSSRPASPQAEMVDLGGKHVMPGLIDLHVHLGNVVDLTQDASFYSRESVEKDLKTYADYGVTTVVSMGTDQDQIFAIRDEQRQGLPTMARVYTAGQGFVYKGGYGGLAGVNEPISSVAEVDRAVAEQAEKGVDLIKIWMDDELGSMPKMPYEMTQAIIDAGHKRGLPVVAHIFYLEDAKRLLEQGIDGFAHSVRDQPVDQALIDAMKRNGTWQIAETLSREASMFAYGEPAPFLNDPFFWKSVSPKTRELLASPERQASIASAAHYHDYPQFLATAQANLKRLADSGVNYGFGTDSGPPGRFPGYFAHWELELMVQSGFTPAEALRTATGRAAEFLKADDLGTLESGNWADFVILDANPLTDIRNTRAISQVYIAGRPVQ